MISRAHRFHGYNALRHVYGRGQIVRGQLFAVKYIINARRTHYRAAVVVSRKVHKSAVVRARIRRRIYEILRTSAGRIDQPYDIVCIVYSDAVATLDTSTLHAMVTEQLERAHILGQQMV